jgi:hypothetical protein
MAILEAETHGLPLRMYRTRDFRGVIVAMIGLVGGKYLINEI